MGVCDYTIKFVWKKMITTCPCGASKSELLCGESWVSSYVGISTDSTGNHQREYMIAFDSILVHLTVINAIVINNIPVRHRYNNIMPPPHHLCHRQSLIAAVTLPSTPPLSPCHCHTNASYLPVPPPPPPPSCCFLPSAIIATVDQQAEFLDKRLQFISPIWHQRWW